MNPAASGAGAKRALVRGANRNLEDTIATHLFVVCPNNSGSTFLASALIRPRAPSGEKPRGVSFTYEAMCAEPERVGREIRAMVPELDDLDLRRRLPVEGYDEMLTDMNARRIARLGAGQVAAFNRVFGGHRDLFGHFGYELLPMPI